MMRGFDSIESMNADELLVKRRRGSKKCMIGAFVIGGLFFIVGILIGYFSHRAESGSGPPPQPEKLDPTHYFIEHVNKDQMYSQLKDFASQPRLSGTPGEYELAKKIQSIWEASGLDDVHIASYNVLLSFPNQSDPNKVEMINKTTGKVVFTALTIEPPLRPEDNTSSALNYNAYSPAGIAKGDVVFVNYGTPEDFDYLTKNLSMNLSGKILIIRYGKMYRGNKVTNAERHNASAVILYTDPADDNRGNGSKPYPDSWWMPDTGVQRGSIYQDNGDPNTPGYPSTGYAHHIDKSKRNLPKIPCQPISYADAQQILRNLSGPASPAIWNIDYKIGPGFENADLELKLAVNNFMDVRPVHNVIGILKGQEEPDRYVLIGNHHDAWVLGATDPESGAIVMNQVISMFGQLLKQGFRPRRSIVFCSWDGEEPALLGSMEWVEDNVKVLYERAVAYINVDMAAEGNFTLIASTSPMLQDALYTAAKQVPSPEKEFKTLYDLWHTRSHPDKSKEDAPSVSYSLGVSGDHAAFYQLAGVSSVDVWVTFDSEKYPLSSYPLYHSAYDSYFTYMQYQDPGFGYTVALTQFSAILMNNLASTPVLPLKVSRYSAAVSGFIQDLLAKYKTVWEKNNVKIDALLSAVEKFTKATSQFENALAAEKDLHNKPLRLRMYNDKIMQLERAFINPEGLPGRPFSKHIVFAPSGEDSYVDTFFPGISDTMYNIEKGRNQWDQLHQQIFITTVFIESAARTLEEIGL